MKTKRILRYGLLMCTMAILGGCASKNENVMSGESAVYDPFESTNRAVFGFNQGVDHLFINPVIKGYKTVVPKPARTGVSNFLTNLKSPVHFTNQVLQADMDGAGDVLTRAIINSILGLGGVIDVAGSEGIFHESEDFGQTLAVWGVGHGPYLVVPILGPSSMRDYFGYFVDSFADPLRWYLFNIDREGLYYAKLGADYVNLRASLIDVLEDLERSSIDYYAATRSTYYQSREAMVKDLSNDIVTPAIPEYDDF